MIDKEKLAKYIRDLEEYLRRLAELQRYSEDEFLSDWRIHDLADRQLHLAVETMLTIGEMMISAYGFRKPDTYADIPRTLCENSIIGKELRDELVNLARLRNVLVHDYLYLDHARVYQHVRDDSSTTFRKFHDYGLRLLRSARNDIQCLGLSLRGAQRRSNLLPAIVARLAECGTRIIGEFIRAIREFVRA